MTDHARELRISVIARSGRAMRLRPIRPEDAPALQRAYRRMDPRDKRARLFAPLPELSNRFAEAFCSVDWEHDLCLVLEAEDEPGEILGGCRLMGDSSHTSAEFAVSLRSDLKGEGLGRKLMTVLLERAVKRGLATVWGTILADNSRMRGLALELGFRLSRDPDDPQLIKATISLATPEPAP